MCSHETFQRILREVEPSATRLVAWISQNCDAAAINCFICRESASDFLPLLAVNEAIQSVLLGVKITEDDQG